MTDKEISELLYTLITSVETWKLFAVMYVAINIVSHTIDLVFHTVIYGIDDILYGISYRKTGNDYEHRYCKGCCKKEI